jgi:hypothetical protein
MLAVFTYLTQVNEYGVIQPEWKSPSDFFLWPFLKRFVNSLYD